MNPRSRLSFERRVVTESSEEDSEERIQSSDPESEYPFGWDRNQPSRSVLGIPRSEMFAPASILHLNHGDKRFDLSCPFLSLEDGSLTAQDLCEAAVVALGVPSTLTDDIELVYKGQKFGKDDTSLASLGLEDNSEIECNWPINDPFGLFEDWNINKDDLRRARELGLRQKRHNKGETQHFLSSAGATAPSLDVQPPSPPSDPSLPQANRKPGDVASEHLERVRTYLNGTMIPHIRLHRRKRYDYLLLLQ